MNTKNKFKQITSLLLSAILFFAVSPISMASGNNGGKKQPQKQPDTTSAYYGKKGKKKSKNKGERTEQQCGSMVSYAMKEIAEQDREVIRHYQSLDESPESLRPVGSVEDYSALIPKRPGLGYRPSAKQSHGKTSAKTTQSATVRDIPCSSLTRTTSPAAKKKTVLRNQLRKFLRLYRKNHRA